MSKACLVDITKCIGCRACQVACKQWNERPAEKTDFLAAGGGYQNPPSLSTRSYTLITYDEVEDAHGNLKWVFTRRGCMHCREPACASACLVKALHGEPGGSVTYNVSLCMGCRYCMIACPFDIPKFEYEKAIPAIQKCTFCFDRQQAGRVPACIKTCPTGALTFGERDEMLDVARTRVYQQPERYVHHIYGEHEAGGTNWLYISSVPFEQLGFRMDLGTTPYPDFTKTFLSAVPQVIIMSACFLTGLGWLAKRRDEVAQTSQATKPQNTEE